MTELRTQTTVLPGHRIEISAPQLAEGTPVEVRIVPTSTAQSQRPSVLDIIESLQGRRVFQTPEQVRRHLQEERDAWDR
jgi:hypothetical protein